MTAFKTSHDPEKLAKKILFMAWQASHVVGMGALQDRGPGLSEDQIWEAASGGRDYGGNRPTKSKQVYADYLFGRMMKLSITWADEEVSLNDNWCRDYQSFCGKYPKPCDLFAAAESSMGKLAESK